MSGGQSYVIRLLRRVESSLSDGHHATESSKVGKIVQELAQADDIHEALDELLCVEGMDQFALRLMWLLDGAERGTMNFDDGVLDYQASLLENLLTTRTSAKGGVNGTPELTAPDEIDQLFVSLHKFGRTIEGLKQQSIGEGGFRGIQEVQLYALLQALALLADQADSCGKKDLSRFATACSGFIHHVLDNGLLHDVRVVNILDNSNFTLQTVFEVAGAEDHDSLSSTIQLLNQPRELLD